MEFETIKFNIAERIGSLTFSRPDVRNAINMSMINELEQVFAQIKQNDNIDVLLITGEDISFCAGADTTEFLNMSAKENEIFLSSFAKIVQEIEELQIPVIGVINGYAFGGGAEIAIACDFRIASNNASFRFPGASYGLVISSRTLPVIVGAPKAKELLFRSCIIPTEEAYRIGLIDQLVEEDELYKYAYRVAKEIQSNSIAAVKKVKETVNAGIGTSMEKRLELEQEANEFLVHHTNYRDTFSAFVEQRKK